MDCLTVRDGWALRTVQIVAEVSIHSRRVGILASRMTDNAAISLRAESTRKGLCLGVLLMMTWRLGKDGYRRKVLLETHK